jgi:hypothetical protein
MANTKHSSHIVGEAELYTFNKQYSKERMHEIKVWRNKSRTKRFGKSLGLRHGNKIKDENNLFTLKKNRGI